MLRSEHSIVRYDFATMTVQPDRLCRGKDDAYVPAINDCIIIYRRGRDRRRQDLHRDVAERLEQIPGCPPRRIASYCKLLDDASTYRSDPRAAVALRQKLFRAAAPLHPIVTSRHGIFEHDMKSARQRICNELGVDWKTIESNLFADVIELQTLQIFDEDLHGHQLLSRYNVAQTQASLYKAVKIRVDAFADFKTIIGQAKLARLMHQIDRLDRPRSGYRFLFDGPTTVLRSTNRYGIGFARLLATLIRCNDWELVARVIGPGNRLFQLRVTSLDGLTSDSEPGDGFDSDLERDVASVWKKRPIDGWTLEHESELLHVGQTVLTPDFALRHDDGRLIHLEVVGFWTPEYLAEKSRRLRMFRISHPDQRWLLLFPKTRASTAADISRSLGVPFEWLGKRSDPADWISIAR